MLRPHQRSAFGPAATSRVKKRLKAKVTTTVV